MTRDEHRAKCIEAMERAWLAHYGIDQAQYPMALKAITAAFDSLHGITVVLTPGEPNGDLTNPPDKKQ